MSVWIGERIETYLSAWHFVALTTLPPRMQQAQRAKAGRVKDIHIMMRATIRYPGYRNDNLDQDF